MRQGEAPDGGAAGQKGPALPSALPVAVSGLAWIHTWSWPGTSTRCPLGASSEAQPVGAISCHRGEASSPAPKREASAVHLPNGHTPFCLRKAIKTSSVPRKVVAEGPVR